MYNLPVHLWLEEPVHFYNELILLMISILPDTSSLYVGVGCAIAFVAIVSDAVYILGQLINHRCIKRFSHNIIERAPIN